MAGQLSGVCGHKLFLPALTGKCVENVSNFDFLVGIPQFHIGNSDVSNADNITVCFRIEGKDFYKGDVVALTLDKPEACPHLYMLYGKWWQSPLLLPWLPRYFPGPVFIKR